MSTKPKKSSKSSRTHHGAPASREDSATTPRSANYVAPYSNATGNHEHYGNQEHFLSRIPESPTDYRQPERVSRTQYTSPGTQNVPSSETHSRGNTRPPVPITNSGESYNRVTQGFQALEIGSSSRNDGVAAPNPHRIPLTSSNPQPTPHIQHIKEQCMSLNSSGASDHHITNRNVRGILDPAFQVRHAKEFKFGKVLKAAWSEPYGAVKKGVQNHTDIRMLQDAPFGQKVYSSIRRFVIVQVFEGHCKCIPILTYQGQGTKKPGVKPHEHAIIYTKDPRIKGPPAELKGEQKLLKKPICVDVVNMRENLDPKSRLNYAKVYTIEYNVKVVFIGTVNEKSKKYFKRDFNEMHPPLSYSPNSGLSDNESRDNSGPNRGISNQPHQLDLSEGSRALQQPRSTSFGSSNIARPVLQYSGNVAVSSYTAPTFANYGVTTTPAQGIRRHSVSYTQNSSGSNYGQAIREPQGGGRSAAAYHSYSNTTNYGSTSAQSQGGRRPSAASITNSNALGGNSHRTAPQQGPSYDHDYNSNYPDDEYTDYHQTSNYRY